MCKDHFRLKTKKRKTFSRKPKFQLAFYDIGMSMQECKYMRCQRMTEERKKYVRLPKWRCEKKKKMETYSATGDLSVFSTVLFCFSHILRYALGSSSSSFFLFGVWWTRLHFNVNGPFDSHSNYTCNGVMCTCRTMCHCRIHVFRFVLFWQKHVRTR